MAKTINIDFAKHNKIFIFACFSIACIVCLFQSNNALSQTVFAPNTYKDSVFILNGENFQQGLSNPSVFEFIGSKSITLSRGFRYKAKLSDIFMGYIHPQLVSQCKYLSTGEISALETGNINTSLPVGSTSGISSVSPTGAFTYAIPIYIPSGTNGMQPSVSLVYNSLDNNGILGWGWGMSGLSMITRVGLNKFKDNKLEQFSNNLSTDKLAIDGNRFVLLEGSWGATNAIYGTEVGNTQRITQHRDMDFSTYFVVENKDGSIIEYGRTEDSRVSVEYKQNSQDRNCTIAWKINKITDRFGNFIVFEYQSIKASPTSKGTCESVIKSIKYSGHQTSVDGQEPVVDQEPYYEVLFDYSLRSDRNTSYLAIEGTNRFDPGNDNAKASINQLVLLDKISIKYIGPESPTNKVIKSYELKYTNNKENYDLSSSDFFNPNRQIVRRIENTGYSQLKSVTEIGENGGKLNPIVFNYEKRTPRSSLIKRLPTTDVGTDDLVFGDFNGDGIQDRMRVKRMQQGGVNNQDYLASWELEVGSYNSAVNGANYSFQPVNYGKEHTSKMFETFDYKESNGQVIYKLYFDKCVVADFNLDGYDDIAIVYYDKEGYHNNHQKNLIYIDYYMSSASGFSKSNDYYVFNPTELKTTPDNSANWNLILTDYNSDDRPDFLITWKDNDPNPATNMFHLHNVHADNSNNYVGLTTPLWEINNPDIKMFPAQLDVDNNVDLAIFEPDLTTGKLKSYYFELNPASNGSYNIDKKEFANSIILDLNWHYELGDLNGDGLMDLVYDKGNRDIYYSYGTGNGFTDGRRLGISAQIPLNAKFYLMDIDRDGKKDILIPFAALEMNGWFPPQIKSYYSCLYSIGTDHFEEQYFTTTDPLLNPLRFKTFYCKDKYDYNKFTDFTGDANGDIYCVDYNNQTCILSFENNSHPLYLKSVIDGFGNKIEVDYEFITNKVERPNNIGKIYTDEAPSNSPLRTIKTNIVVVSSTSNYSYLPFNSTNKNKLNNTIYYSYGQGLIHPKKGFLGFSDFTKSSFYQYGESSLNTTLAVEKSTYKISGNDKFELLPAAKYTAKGCSSTNVTDWDSEETWEYDYKNVNNEKTTFYYIKKSISNDLTHKTSKSREVLVIDDWENDKEEKIIYSEDGVEIAYERYIYLYMQDVHESFSTWPWWCQSFLFQKDSYSRLMRDNPNDPNEYHRQVQYEYYAANEGFALKKVINDPQSNENLVKEFDYDKWGNQISKKYSQSFTQELPNRETVFEYEPTGRFLKSTSNGLPTNNIYATTYEYYPQSGLLKVKGDPQIKKTEYEYDEFFRTTNSRTYTEDPNASVNLDLNSQTQIHWITSLPVGNISEATYYKELISSNSPKSYIYYTSDGRELRTKTEAFLRNDYLAVDKTYYNDGRLKSTTYPYFTTFANTNKLVKYYYDEKFRIGAVDDINRVTRTTYAPTFGGNTNPREVLVTDPSGKKISKIFDALGNIIASADINILGSGKKNIIKYKYANNFNLKETTSKLIDKPDDVILTTREYDPLGRLVNMVDKDLGEFDYKYNPYGELYEETLKSEEDGNGGINKYKKYYFYDELGRVKRDEVRLNNNTTSEEHTDYTYIMAENCGAGQLDQINFYVGTTLQQAISYTYNYFGAITSRSETVGLATFTNEYNYNSLGNLTWQKYPSGVETVPSYDSKTGLMYKLNRVDNGHSEILWEMEELNEQGLSNKYTMGNDAITTDLTFDPLYGFPKTRSTHAGSVVIQNLNYTFNSSNRSCETREDLKNNQVETFQYDILDRLNSITIDNNKQFTINYHDDGSISDMTDNEHYPEVRKYRYGNYDASTPTPKEDPVFPYHGVKATSLKTSQNLDQMPTLESKYNFHRMISELMDDNDKANFTYGYDNSRIYVSFQKKNSQGNWTHEYTKYYQGSYEKYVYLTSDPKEITYINTPSGLIAAIVKTGPDEKTYYVHKDYLGSILALSEVDYTTTPSTVSIVAQFSYDAWGNPRPIDNWTSNYTDDLNVPNFGILERGFTGHEHIRQFNIINMNARLYDPRIGRFFSPDNYITESENPQSYNRYSYALNNPLKYTDPTGNFYYGSGGNFKEPFFPATVQKYERPNSHPRLAVFFSTTFDALDNMMNSIQTDYGGGGGKGAGGSPPKDPEKEEEKKEGEKDPEKKEESKEKEVNIPEERFVKGVQEDATGCLFRITVGILNGMGIKITERELKEKYKAIHGDSWAVPKIGANIFDMQSTLQKEVNAKLAFAPINETEMMSTVEKGYPQIAFINVEYKGETYGHFVGITGYRTDRDGNTTFKYWDPGKGAYNYAPASTFDTFPSKSGAIIRTFMIGYTR